MLRKKMDLNFEGRIIMSEDSFTEVTNQSWFSRIGNSIRGILVGIVIFIIAFPVLFWNEGRAVSRYKTLKEGAGNVVTIDSATVDPANEGKLVHLTGKATTDETLTDSQFGISANAIKLNRNVEIYQWKENKKTKTKKKTGGSTQKTTTYNYTKAWSKTLVKSGSFNKQSGHENPTSMPFSEQKQMATNVKLGGFDLSSGLVRKINAYESLPVTDSVAIPADLASKLTKHNGGFYYGSNPASPAVGDMKITFQAVKPLEVSMISKQIGSTFEPYLSRKTGKKLEIIKAGTFSADVMFADAKKSNAVTTWLLRGLGFILMFVGITMVLKPLSVVADVLPFLGNLVGAASGLVAGLVAGLFSMVVISVAWIIYRPLLGIVLLLIAGGIAYALKVVSDKKKEAAA
jgi:hypothetical protein